MNFWERPASSNWEPLTLPVNPPAAAWAWFKPAHVPTGVVFRVAEESFQDAGERDRVSVRMLAAAASIDAAEIASWTLLGRSFAGDGGANPLLDSPVPEIPATVDPSIVVAVGPPEGSIPATMAPATGDVEEGDAYAAIEGDWNAIIKLERQLSAARKQLTGTFGRLNALNRDFTADERRFADNLDVTDWAEARRWLRDAASKVHRLVKAHDVGVTSMAGQRTRFETIYEQSVVPRRPIDGIGQVRRDFDSHRKTAQHLLNSMTAANDSAVRDGEGRARRILSRVQSKARAGRRKV